MFHTLAARASGELCLKYIFSFGALARTPLVDRYADWCLCSYLFTEFMVHNRLVFPHPIDKPSAISPCRMSNVSGGVSGTLLSMLSTLLLILTPQKILNYLKIYNWDLAMYSAPDWKVPTSFIYGTEDWMDYRGAMAARERMNVPCEIIRVPKVHVLLFIEVMLRTF